MKSNILFLGIAIAIITLALVQIFSENMLPMSIYMCVAWGSLILSLGELLKASLYRTKMLRSEAIRMIKNGLDLSDQHIAIFDMLPGKEKEKIAYCNTQRKLTERYKKYEKNDPSKKIEVSIRIVSVAQTIILFAGFACGMTKNIPNGPQENRVISILSLLSFAILFVSYYLTHAIDEKIREDNRIAQEIDGNTRYYLQLINSILNDKEIDNKKTRAEEKSYDDRYNGKTL